jgi:hypothetical protein
LRLFHPKGRASLWYLHGKGTLAFSQTFFLTSVNMVSVFVTSSQFTVTSFELFVQAERPFCSLHSTDN